MGDGFYIRKCSYTTITCVFAYRQIGHLSWSDTAGPVVSDQDKGRICLYANTQVRFKFCQTDKISTCNCIFDDGEARFQWILQTDVTT